MEIERINENTVKFYISYLDIEERGFDKEEIWYNRERSEELFWEMMDEVHQEEEFMVEGPLWIQVQALEKGLEVLVTKAQVTKDGQKFELPMPDDKKQSGMNENIEDLLEAAMEEEDNDTLEFLVVFDDFEDAVSLAKRDLPDFFSHSLYAYEGKYYLYTLFEEEQATEEEIENVLSILLEYSEESPLTVHRLEEYGTSVAQDNALAVLRQHFT
ncbi:adaptor protein MecA [Bacillus fonticola]|uniref:adaptor protein MecA n=1 Tax=Bacillus fonticola TaxID=2728853 RepID=UPI001474B761|nr:adaptor protein MecA [Bacillus fonticola]